MKLACYIDVIDHPYLFSVMCDDQFINLLQFTQVVFQSFGVFFWKLYVQANFVNLNLN